MSYLDERAALGEKVALVLGGGSGIGKACALDLGRAGMRVAIADRDSAALGSTLAELEAHGIETLGGEFDVRDGAALARFFATAKERFGPGIHVVVNVVGGTFEQRFEESKPRGWSALAASNLNWLLEAIQLALPGLRAAAGGSIINISTVEAHRAAPGYAVYAAMKAAVESLTKTLALELAADGIRVNSIAPDVVPTDGWVELMNVGADVAAVELSYQIAIPLGRVGTVEEVSGCALFLASELSRYVTGTCLHVDGGTLASSGWFNWPGSGFANRLPTALARQLLDSLPVATEENSARDA